MIIFSKFLSIIKSITIQLVVRPVKGFSAGAAIT